MSTALCAQTVRAVAEAAMSGGRRARFSMRGSSMLPLLHEPMILVVAPVERRAQVGELLVFTQSDAQIVHRVVGFAGGEYITSGDAQPHLTERVPSSDVLGVVESVWEDGSESARRVDTRGHRLRGSWYARAYFIRRRRAAARARLHEASSRVRGTLFRVHGMLSRLRDSP